MNQVPRQNFVLFMMIIALITMGISPACKFISGGENFIEICTADGFERLAINTDQNPASDQKDGGNAHKDMPCMFCFAAHTGKASQSLASYTAVLSTVKAAYALHDYQIKRTGERRPFEARAPPVFS